MRPTPAQHFSPSSFLYAQQTFISTTPPFALLLVIPAGNLLLLLPLPVLSIILIQHNADLAVRNNQGQTVVENAATQMNGPQRLEVLNKAIQESTQH
jgi:apolipoprotein N-acyltransferase